NDTQGALTLIEVFVVVLITTLLIAVLLTSTLSPLLGEAARVRSGSQTSALHDRLPGGAQVSSTRGWSPYLERGALRPTSPPPDSVNVTPSLGDARAAGPLTTSAMPLRTQNGG